MWLRAGGYGVVIDPDAGQPDEHDTFTCKHCSKVVIVRARQRPEDIGGLCRHCYGIICPDCVGKDCTPFIAKIDAFERNLDRWRQWAREEGLGAYGE